jgi:Tol biopolymer transport system component
MRNRAIVVMVCAVCAVCAVVAAQWAHAQAQAEWKAKKLTPEQVLNVRSIGDLHFSPDGARLAFVVTEPVKGTAARAQHIWMMDVSTREMRHYTNSAKSENSPRWSPDGKTLAFLSDREEFRQIFFLSMEGGEARRVTEGKRAVTWFAWSPDGKQVAFLAQEPRTDAEEKKDKDKDDARVTDKDDRMARLWMMAAESGKVRQVTSGRWRIAPGEWLPDGSAIVVSATDHPEAEDERNRIYKVMVADGKFTEIAAPKGPFGGLRVSPDGKMIAYVCSRMDGDTASARSACTAIRVRGRFTDIPSCCDSRWVSNCVRPDSAAGDNLSTESLE